MAAQHGFSTHISASARQTANERNDSLKPQLQSVEHVQQDGWQSCFRRRQQDRGQSGYVGSSFPEIPRKRTSLTLIITAVRVRPPLKQDDPGFDLVPQRFRSARCHVTSPSSLAVDPASGGRKVFVFDRVFGEDVDQEGVFEYVTESVNSFVEGYNVSILAYGQSGAGKSYTMGTTGPSDQGDAQVMGIIPRAAALLYEKLEGPSNRAPGSGIRPPNARVSSMGSHNFASRPTIKKNWQLTATYVEVNMLLLLTIPLMLMYVDLQRAASRSPALRHGTAQLAS